ncbi:hypothetical protein H8B09_19480 [Paenibacillus sp. PR3]|uniref:Uncharacterized protein n=1 Tax=Paenibacillus terricola TaxID=2763503 RepID=A0ABR8MYD1_9BACL|nr:hypothetical protein [Paenibacillus terricola]MBD3920957.1 hypothetical protein [Paenibacillus terricola]
MSVIKLEGVELTQAFLSKCKHCKGLLEVRKLELQYQSNQRKGQTAFLMADVWYCARCDHGYLLDAFKTVLDASNRSWRVMEVGRSKSAGSTVRSPVKGAPITHSNPVVHVTLTRIETIDFIIGDQVKACVNCGNSLMKQMIELCLTREDNAKIYTPCEAYQCGSCHQWMLRRQQSTTLQTSNSPYKIHVIHNDRIYESLSHIKHRSQLVQTTDASRLKISGQPTDKLNNQFNKYGVFIPAPTNKKGYFDE